METIAISSFSDFHAAMRDLLYDRQYLFRGHNDVSWSLTPKIGRPEFQGIDTQHFMASFKRRALEFMDIEPRDEWDWYAVAQHHGLPTPFLDWTFNPLVAGYFAAFPVEPRDCAVYVYRAQKSLKTDGVDPISAKGVSRVMPRGLASRIVRQSGNFTYHNPVQLSLENGIGANDRLLRLVIAADYRKDFVFELDRYGINRMTLFPDLDGLSSYMAWNARCDVRDFWTKKRKTNQALLPTPTSVTDRAGARSAPDAGAADL